MEKKGCLLSYRPDIKVVDCTIRDGGLVNSFYFDDEFVKDLYKANIDAGVDYMEFGYKASKKIFDETKFGKWKFCEETDIREIVGENNTNLKISVMADVGRTDMEDFLPKSESVVDLVRVATYINTIPTAIEMVETLHKLGYETSVNIMAISKASESDVNSALEQLGASSVDCIYLVDSYGSLYPEQIRELAKKYLSYAEKFGKSVGIHAHNNQQLAFANTIEALTPGISYLDATMSSLGRGAGNCPLELLLGFLKNPKYQLPPVLKFIENHILRLKEDGLVWGYDVPYMLTGRLNQHPSAAIQFIKDKNTNYSEFYQEIFDTTC